jgi:transcriptional regulator with XRE-family HTH domain
MRAPLKTIYLRTLRMQRGLSQEQLQVLSKVPQNTISRLETNPMSRPSFTTVDALARVLRVDPRQLRFGPDPDATPPKSHEAVA